MTTTADFMVELLDYEIEKMTNRDAKSFALTKLFAMFQAQTAKKDREYFLITELIKANYFLDIPFYINALHLFKAIEKEDVPSLVNLPDYTEKATDKEIYEDLAFKGFLEYVSYDEKTDVLTYLYPEGTDHKDFKQYVKHCLNIQFLLGEIGYTERIKYFSFDRYLVMVKENPGVF